MLTIQLRNLQFHAYHGLYEHENLLGNTFEIDADVALNADEPITKLSQTVNYATIYALIKEKMGKATPLLETVAQELTNSIHLLDKRILSITITIRKLSPPIENFQGTIGVTYKKDF